jgi:hypothetical protein
MRRRAGLLILAAVVLGLAVSGPAAATVRRDGEPTTLAKEAKALGISKAGARYRFHKEKRSSDTLLLSVDVPTAWSDTADSHFVRPDTHEPYGVGVRATTDADKFHTSFAVPGVKVNVDVVPVDQAPGFDPTQLVASNAYKGCRNGSVRPYDNGTFAGMYQVFDRCGKKHAAAVVVAATDRGTELLVSAQVLTKADLKAIDRALSTVTVEKTSV